MPTDIRTILKLTVPVKVLIGRRQIPLDDVLALGPGAILELNRSSDERLELMVNNKYVGEGIAVKVGENFGIRVLALGDRRELAKAIVRSGDDADEAA